MEVVIEKQNQSQIPRTIMELKKKRKLQAEQLGLPLPKHKFGDRTTYNSESCLHHHHTGYNNDGDGDGDDDDSELDSVKDSSSLADESDSSMSTSASISTTFPKLKMDSINLKTCSDRGSSSSSSSSSIIINPQNNKLKLLRPYQEDELHEFGALMEYDCLDQGMECEEVGKDNHHFVLSSGRWTTDQGMADDRKRDEKLTIDKEFEQYFSMLML